MVVKKLAVRAAAVASLFVPQILLAADPVDRPGLSLLASAGVKHDSNIYQAPDGPQEVDSRVDVFEPDIRYFIKHGLNRYIFNYSALAEKYEEDSDSDHVDHHFFNRNHMEFNARNALNIDFIYHKQQNVQDSVNRSDPREEAGNRYHIGEAALEYQYGAPGAPGRLEIGGDYQSLRFDNNRNTASLNRFRDRDIATGFARLLVRLAPKTHTVFEARYQDYDFRDDVFLLSNSTSAFLAGVKWDATAKTAGSILVGGAARDFESSFQQDSDYFVWESSLSWQPKTYSTFVLSTGRYLEAGSARENTIKASEIRLDWTHSWTDRVVSKVAAAHQREDYEGNVNDGRSDDTSSAEIRLDYNLQRWLAIGVGFKYLDRDSNLVVEEFKRSISSLYLTVML